MPGPSRPTPLAAERNSESSGNGTAGTTRKRILSGLATPTALARAKPVLLKGTPVLATSAECASAHAIARGMNSLKSEDQFAAADTTQSSSRKPILTVTCQ